MSSTWKAKKRVEEFNRKKREQRAMKAKPLGSSEAARKNKLKEAKSKRPGFGMGTSSVSDHLNDVVFGGKKRVAGKQVEKSMRELRDERIAAEAKSRTLKPRPGGGSRTARGGGRTLGSTMSSGGPSRAALADRYSAPGGAQSTVMKSMMRHGAAPSTDMVAARARAAEAKMNRNTLMGNIGPDGEADGGGRTAAGWGSSQRSEKSLKEQNGGKGNVWRLQNASGGSRLGGKHGLGRTGGGQQLSQAAMREARAKAAEARFAAMSKGPENSNPCE